MTETKIFDYAGNSLKNFIRNLSVNEIKSCCTPSTFKLGNDYFTAGKVTEFEYITDAKIIASVEGNDNYEIIIDLNENTVTADCDCTYDEVCKHTVAVLLHAITDKNAIEESQISDSDALEGYLETLNKQDLIALLKEHLPANFLETLK